MYEFTRATITCVKYGGGARQEVARLYRHHSLYQNIGGSSGMPEHAHYTKLCIRTMGTRPGCAIIPNTPYIYIYINLSERLGVCPFVSVSVRSGGVDRLAMRCFTFAELLLCPHKCIVTMTKVYIASNNKHVEIRRFRKISDFNDILKFQGETLFRDKCAHCYP